MLVSDTVNLYPMTPRAVILLDNDSGSGWAIKSISDTVRFSDKEGPWLFLTKDTNKSMWIHGIHDDNFKVISTSNIYY